MAKPFTQYLFAVIATVISFILLTLPGSELPGNPLLARLQVDKIVHVIMFGGLVWLWCRALLQNKKASQTLFIIIAVVFALYGITMEFVQEYYVVNRSFDIYDIAADIAGCLAGLICSTRWYIKE